MRENDKHFYKNLFVLVLPIAFQNLMSALVSASDAMMLGMVNQDSLSAVSPVLGGPDHRDDDPGCAVLGKE